MSSHDRLLRQSSTPHPSSSLSVRQETPSVSKPLTNQTAGHSIEKFALGQSAVAAHSPLTLQRDEDEQLLMSVPDPQPQNQTYSSPEPFVSVAESEQVNQSSLVAGIPPVNRETFGWHPDDGIGPYAHISKVNETDLQAGFGALKRDFDNGSELDILNANANLGVFGDLREGNMRIGGRANMQEFRGSFNNPEFLGGSLGFDADVMAASVEESIGQDGFTFGGQADIIEAAARIGNLNADEVNDEQFRTGIGAGIGWEARGHWGDRDHDGHREVGFGFDAGIGTMDIKTEDPVMTLLKNPTMMGGAIGWGIDLLTDDKDTNLTTSLLQNFGVDW